MQPTPPPQPPKPEQCLPINHPHKQPHTGNSNPPYVSYPQTPNSPAPISPSTTTKSYLVIFTKIKSITLLNLFIWNLVYHLCLGRLGSCLKIGGCSGLRVLSCICPMLLMRRMRGMCVSLRISILLAIFTAGSCECSRLLLCCFSRNTFARICRNG